MSTTEQHIKMFHFFFKSNFKKRLFIKNTLVARTVIKYCFIWHWIEKRNFCMFYFFGKYSSQLELYSFRGRWRSNEISLVFNTNCVIWWICSFLHLMPFCLLYIQVIMIRQKFHLVWYQKKNLQVLNKWKMNCACINTWTIWSNYRLSASATSNVLTEKGETISLS